MRRSSGLRGKLGDAPGPPISLFISRIPNFPTYHEEAAQRIGGQT